MLPQTNRVASPIAIRDIAQATEDLGFYGVTVHDHLGYNGWWIVSGMRGIDLEGDDRVLYEALETLGYVSGLTNTVRLGVSVVVVPMRQPAVLAKQLATIDTLSEGRLRIGVGVGPPLKVDPEETTRLGRHRENAAREYAASGLSGERGRRTDEYLRAMISIWTEDKSTFKGEFVSFQDLEVFPKPTQKPYPPILVGGRSEAALARCARFEAGWVPSQVSASEVSEGATRLTEMYRQRGLGADPEIVVNIPVVLAESDDDARKIADATISHVFANETEYHQRTIVGSPKTFARRLEDYLSAGASHFELKPLYPSIENFIWQLRTIQEEVVPLVKGG